MRYQLCSWVCCLAAQLGMSSERNTTIIVVNEWQFATRTYVIPLTQVQICSRILAGLWLLQLSLFLIALWVLMKTLIKYCISIQTDSQELLLFYFVLTNAGRHVVVQHAMCTNYGNISLCSLSCRWGWVSAEDSCRHSCWSLPVALFTEGNRGTFSCKSREPLVTLQSSALCRQNGRLGWGERKIDLEGKWGQEMGYLSHC